MRTVMRLVNDINGRIGSLYLKMARYVCRLMLNITIPYRLFSGNYCTGLSRARAPESVAVREESG